MTKLADLKADAARRERSVVVTWRCPVGKPHEFSPTSATWSQRYEGDTPLRLLVINPADL